MSSMEYLVIDSNKRKRAGHTLFERFKTWVWNAQYRTVWGRDARSWALLLAFYWLFLWALVIFCITAYAMFYLSIDKNYPRYHHGHSYSGFSSAQLSNKGARFHDKTGLLLPGPGMGFRPNPDYRGTLVRFVQGRPSSYKFHTNHIQAYLELYEKDESDGEQFIDCDGLTPDQKEDKKVCTFDVSDLGEGCTWQRDFGYDEGQPCVLLKINKVYGWKPIPYNATNCPEELRQKGIECDPKFLPVTCEGESPMDQENIGEVIFTPKAGFPVLFYPYLNQEGYRQPLIFAKFKRPTNGVLINIWCKAWARNIDHHREDRVGSIHFELLVD